ncbi:unnamed protein product, partial [marine sediment metagenome]
VCGHRKVSGGNTRHYTSGSPNAGHFPATPDSINPPVSIPADENHNLGEIDNEASSSA